MLTLIAYRFAIDSQLPRLPYMTRLDAFILTSTILVFFSLIEVLVTTILDHNQQAERAKKIDRYCRVIFPVIFGVASIAISCAGPRLVQNKESRSHNNVRLLEVACCRHASFKALAQFRDDTNV